MIPTSNESRDRSAHGSSEVGSQIAALYMWTPSDRGNVRLHPEEWLSARKMGSLELCMEAPAL